MRIGVTLGQVDGATGQTVAVADLARQAETAERLGFESVWLMDHFWSERDGRRAGGHEPLISLAFIAARTERVQLGVLVLCHAFRHAGQLAREAAALADASGGRLVLGLGAGWYDAEFEAFGLPVQRKVSRLAEAVPLLKRLLAGETVDHEGESLTLRGASIIGSAAPPPLWLGALQPRMMDLAARHADGWNTVWGGADTAWFAEQLTRFRAAQAAAGRAAAEVTVSAGIFCIPDPSVDGGARVAAGDARRLAEVWRAYGAAGVDHLVVNLAETPFRLRDRAYLELAGRALEVYRSL
jgi:alkanesulfonate monooxygenase SsuD/methylene tetrahydromethanopterin reductase-like flavin-dependent oxidoreductase (luciferase family)